MGSTVTVKDQNGNAISNSNIDFGKYQGSTFKTIKKKDIPSGEDFYIRIKSNTGISKITGATGTVKMHDTSVDLIFFEPVSDSTQNWQNLMVTEKHSTPTEDYIDFSYDIELLGDLWIKKVNTDDNSIVFFSTFSRQKCIM